MVPKFVVPLVEVWIEISSGDASFLSYSFIVFPSRCDYPNEVINGKFWGRNSKGGHFLSRFFWSWTFLGGSKFGGHRIHDMESFIPPYVYICLIANILSISI